MKKQSILQVSEKIAEPLQAIASTQRIAILLAIGNGEACVCHLEAALGWRQAYISQHLMALRKADVLQDRRRGRYVFYRLKDASLLDLIAASARLSGTPRRIGFHADQHTSQPHVRMSALFAGIDSHRKRKDSMNILSFFHRVTLQRIG